MVYIMLVMAVSDIYYAGGGSERYILCWWRQWEIYTMLVVAVSDILYYAGDGSERYIILCWRWQWAIYYTMLAMAVSCILYYAGDGSERYIILCWRWQWTQNIDNYNTTARTHNTGNTTARTHNTDNTNNNNGNTAPGTYHRAFCAETTEALATKTFIKCSKFPIPVKTHPNIHKSNWWSHEWHFIDKQMNFKNDFIKWLYL